MLSDSAIQSATQKALTYKINRVKFDQQNKAGLELIYVTCVESVAYYKICHKSN